MSHQKPSYSIEEFKAACGQLPPQVFVSAGAMVNAADDFGLKTQQSVRDFIFNGGLEDLSFTHTDIFRNNQDLKTVIMEDEYSFRTRKTHGYIAFFKNPKKGTWMIKSFKKNWDSPMQSSFVFKRSGSPRLIIGCTEEETK